MGLVPRLRPRTIFTEYSVPYPASLGIFPLITNILSLIGHKAWLSAAWKLSRTHWLAMQIWNQLLAFEFLKTATHYFQNFTIHPACCSPISIRNVATVLSALIGGVVPVALDGKGKNPPNVCLLGDSMLWHSLSGRISWLYTVSPTFMMRENQSVMRHDVHGTIPTVHRMCDDGTYGKRSRGKIHRNKSIYVCR